MMLRPSYNDLIQVVNSGVEPGEEPVVQSRYSIVIATAKRARQLIGGEEATVMERARKPLSVAMALPVLPTVTAGVASVRWEPTGCSPTRLS